MPEPFDSSVLQEHLARWQSGDRTAADELLRAVSARLEKLARRMLRQFPTVRCHVDTDDVMQSSVLRLLRTLQRLKPVGVRDFFNLAAVHIRRELIDIVRKTRGKTTVPLETAPDGDIALESTPPDESADLDRWLVFHTAVDRLPVEEREVVGLIFYHGWTQDRIGALFNVDARTIRRRWAAACTRLQQIAGVDFFE